MTNKFYRGILFLCAFLLLIILLETVNIKKLPESDSELGLSAINESVAAVIPFNSFWYGVSEVLGYITLFVALCFASVGAIELIKRKSLLKVDKPILVLGGLYIITVLLYLIFNHVSVNVRPVLLPGEEAFESSFPSSHSLLAITVWGSTYVLITKFLKNKRRKSLFHICCVFIAASLVITRFLSGAHWLTDIIGGLLLGAALVFIFSSFLQIITSGKNHNS